MNRKITITLLIAAIFLIAANAWLYLTTDRKAPRITFDYTLEQWTPDDGKEILLTDAHAQDNIDGDVSSTIRIKNVIVSNDEQSVTVVYLAKDSRNNIATANRVLRYIPGEQPVEVADETVPEETEAETPSEETEPASAEEPESTAEETSSSETEPATLSPQEENESRIAELPAGAPHISLSEYVVGVAAGGSLNLLSYVSDVSDDVDSRDYLMGRIEIDGEVNYNAPGEYELRFYVRDSSQNRSNAAIMKVVVQ